MKMPSESSNLMLLWLFLLVTIASAMRPPDPGRIEARLRIEEEILNDKMVKLGRKRRQLGGQPKEISIQVTAPLFSSRLFDYGPDAGDQELPQNLDAIKQIDLGQPISFYGQEYSTVYILGNGAIGFDSSSKNYRSNILPGTLKMIAPFWNRNDLRNGGHVYYREITTGRVLERGQSEIRYQYDKNVKVRSTLLVTWSKMQPLGADPLPDENTNTFQAAIFVTSNGTFANFIYSNIGWTQGAESGFSKGDSTEHFALPTSGTGNIMYLEEYGNTGIPGEWMFELAEPHVIRCKVGIKGDTCDEECGHGEWGVDCRGCCHCASGGACNPVTGQCNSGICSECWIGSTCQEKKDTCANGQSIICAHNAISFTDYDRCGEPMQRCQCLAGFVGDGYKECHDVNECDQPNTCHENAVCTNTPGRFFCQCAEGFSGDGVEECIATFLYPIDTREQLPKRTNSKVGFNLRYPLNIFGEMRNQITISSNGLIIVEQMAQFQPGDHLDDMEVLGIAPFFSAIDLSNGGEISISETTDSDVLTRATKTINENLEKSNFMATSVVTITFMNVSTMDSDKTNTFQAVLVGGTNQRHDNLTFIQLLYKDLNWNDNAEVGIMTLDKMNSIHLPGSGTEGIEQLSQLSNIKSPGMWLYRIDSDTVFPCTRLDLQPPYCDAESPTLVSKPAPAITTPLLPVSERMKSVEEPQEDEGGDVPKPEDIPIEIPDGTVEIDQPEPPVISLVTPRPSDKPRSKFHPAFHGLTTPTTRRSTTRYVPPSTTHVPIVSLGSKEIEEIPSDAFDITIPPFMTIVPHILSAEDVKLSRGQTKRPGGFGSLGASPEEVSSFNASVPWPGSKIRPVPIWTGIPEVPTETKVVVTQPSLLTYTEKTNTNFIQAQETSKIVVPQPQPPSQDIHEFNKPEIDFGGDQDVVVIDQPEQVIVPQTIRPQLPKSPQSPISFPPKTTQTPTQPPPTTTTTKATPPSLSPQQPSSTTVSTKTPQIFVFTTTPKPIQRTFPTKLKIVTDHPPGSYDPNAGATLPFDPNRILDVETSGSKLAVIIPTTIVAVWLFILLIIAIVVCCQRRRSAHNLRNMYGPAYQIRPVATGFTVRKTSKGFDSYEDHLEKAARLSSEMSSYNSGRVSLYGSYWNLSNGASPDSGSTPGGSGSSINGHTHLHGHTNHGLTTSNTNNNGAMSSNSRIVAGLNGGVNKQHSPSFLPYTTSRKERYSYNGRY